MMVLHNLRYWLDRPGGHAVTWCGKTLDAATATIPQTVLNSQEWSSCPVCEATRIIVEHSSTTPPVANRQDA